MARFEDHSYEVLYRIVRNLQGVVKETTENIEATAKNLVRVDISPTADNIVLKDSITSEAENLTGVVYVAGEAQEYARTQEYGHPVYPNYGFTPYLRPAIEQEREQFLANVRRALQI